MHLGLHCSLCLRGVCIYTVYLCGVYAWMYVYLGSVSVYCVWVVSVYLCGVWGVCVCVCAGLVERVILFSLGSLFEGSSSVT